MEADTNSCRFEFVPVSYKYPLTSCTIDLRRPWARAFFEPTSRTVDFSLWLKHSDHEITFFVALRFRKYRSRDAIFCCSPKRKHETMLTARNTGRSYIVQSNWGQTLNKLQQKVFQRIMAHSDVLNNKSKVPKNRSSGRPRKTEKKIPIQSLYEKPQGTQFI